MRQRTLALVLLFTFCSACDENKPPTPKPTISAAEAVARAELAAKKFRLPNDLEAAGTNIKKLARVYRVAEEVGDTKIQAKADKLMVKVVVTKMVIVPSKGRAKKLLRQVPEGSLAAQELERIQETLK
jgi:hypothetical protein